MNIPMVKGTGLKLGFGMPAPILSELARILTLLPRAGRVLRHAFRMGGRSPKPRNPPRPQNHLHVQSPTFSVGRFGFLLVAIGMPLTTFAAPASLGVVKYAKGNLKVTAAGDTSERRDLLPSELVQTGAKIEAGSDGKAVLRLLPDQAFMEIRPKTVFTIKRVKTKDKRVRRVTLEAGEVVFGLKKKSEAVQCENAQTQATASAGRFSCKSDEKGVAQFLVQDGELSVYNRPKDLTAVVRTGQKAVSDLNGIKVTDATDSELEEVGFRQNTIEVDFVNPETEDFTTLEVEYETNF